MRPDAPDFTSDRLPLITLLMMSALAVYRNNSEVPEVKVPPVSVAAAVAISPPEFNVRLSEPDIVNVRAEPILRELTMVPPATSVPLELIRMLSPVVVVPEERRFKE